MKLRLPRKLLENLNETIFKHDSQFLEAVCSQLGIPFKEAKQKILGFGSEITVCENLPNETNQCEFYFLHSKTGHYQRCHNRQIPGSSSCSDHHCFFNMRTRTVIHKDSLTELGNLQWIWHPKMKRYFLGDTKSGKVYTANDEPCENLRVWVSGQGSICLLNI